MYPLYVLTYVRLVTGVTSRGVQDSTPVLTLYVAPLGRPCGMTVTVSPSASLAEMVTVTGSRRMASITTGPFNSGMVLSVRKHKRRECYRCHKCKNHKIILIFTSQQQPMLI